MLFAVVIRKNTEPMGPQLEMNRSPGDVENRVVYGCMSCFDPLINVSWILSLLLIVGY